MRSNTKEKLIAGFIIARLQYTTPTSIHKLFIG